MLNFLKRLLIALLVFTGLIHSSPSISPNPTPSKSVTTTHSVSATGPESCNDNDMSCFMTAADTCFPATVEWTATLDFLGFFTETAQSRFILKGPDSSGKCIFSERVDTVDLSISPQAAEQAKAKGATDAQIQRQL